MGVKTHSHSTINTAFLQEIRINQKNILVETLAIMNYTYYVCSTNPSKSNKA